MAQTPIPVRQLVDGQWYLGEGRLGPLAKWDAKLQCFAFLDYEWGMHTVGEMDYGKGFMPYQQINLEQLDITFKC